MTMRTGFKMSCQANDLNLNVYCAGVACFGVGLPVHCAEDMTRQARNDARGAASYL